MPSHSPLAQSSGRKTLVIGLLLLPLGCLLWQWAELPAQVPIHFSRHGADHFADKRLLWAYTLLPLLLYLGLTRLYPTAAGNRRLVAGTAIFLSLVLCLWLTVGMAAR
jgi:hypothetical protein